MIAPPRRRRIALALSAPALLATCAITSEVSRNPVPRTTSELVSAVREAAAVVAREGEAAFVRLAAEGSPWRHEGAFVFVLDTEGKFVFHGLEPARVGTSALALEDADGRPFGRRLVEIATGEAGEGFCFSRRVRPGRGEPEWRMSFLSRVAAPSGRAYAVGSGAYDVAPDRELLVALVEEAAPSLARGGEGALRRIDDTRGPFAYRDVALFVLSLDGDCLASGRSAGLAGRNLALETAVNGSAPADGPLRVVRRRGSGFCETYWPHAEGPSGRVFAYVRLATLGSDPVIVGASFDLDEPTATDARPRPPRGDER